LNLLGKEGTVEKKQWSFCGKNIILTGYNMAHMLYIITQVSFK